MKNNIKSVIVLTSICLVVAFMLAVTNYFTKDKIAENNSKAAFEACFEVMPNATNFEEVNLAEYSGLPASLKNAYKETSGLGYTYKVVVTGKNPDLTIMVGIDTEGKITKSTVVSSQETPSYFGGSIEENYSNQFAGKDSILSGISIITGATLSTKAYMNGVMDAFSANAIIAGMSVTKSKEMLIAEVLTATTSVIEVTTNVDLGTNVTAVYNSEQYDGLAVEVTINEIKYYICMDYTGKVLGFSAESVDELSEGFTLTSSATNAVETELLNVATNINTSKQTLIFDAIGSSLKTILGNQDATFDIYNATFNMPKIEKQEMSDYLNENKNISATIGAIYTATDGYVYLVNAIGHNGAMKLLVSIDTEGKVIDTLVLHQAETNDFAAGVWSDSYQDRYHGIGSITTDIVLSGATVTSTTYSISVKCALEAYSLMAGGSN